MNFRIHNAIVRWAGHLGVFTGVVAGYGYRIYLLDALIMFIGALQNPSKECSSAKIPGACRIMSGVVSGLAWPLVIYETSTERTPTIAGAVCASKQPTAEEK